MSGIKNMQDKTMYDAAGRRIKEVGMCSPSYCCIGDCQEDAMFVVIQHDPPDSDPYVMVHTCQEHVSAACAPCQYDGHDVAWRVEPISQHTWLVDSPTFTCGFGGLLIDVEAEGVRLDSLGPTNLASLDDLGRMREWIGAVIEELEKRKAENRKTVKPLPSPALLSPTTPCDPALINELVEVLESCGDNWSLPAFKNSRDAVIEKVLRARKGGA